MVKDASEHFFAPDQVRPYDTDFVIDKREPRHFQVDGGQGRQFEYWSKGGMSLSRPEGKISSDIVRVGRASASHKIGEEVRHSASYSPALVRELLKGVVEEDYLVLDPFCGQATTGIVAAELNCRFIGYDMSLYPTHSVYPIG